MSFTQPTPRDYLILLLLGAVWGGNFLLIKIGVETIPGTSFAVMRLAIAAVTMAGLALYRGESFKYPRQPGDLFCWPQSRATPCRSY